MQTTKPKQRTKYNAQAKNIALPWTVLVILVLAVGFGFGVGTLPFQTASANKTFFCTPNGIVHLPWKSADSYNQCWDPALFLSITLAFGRLSFTAAKAIDVIWDLFVGRGGQVLLGWVTYTIVRRSLVTAMES